MKYKIFIVVMIMIIGVFINNAYAKMTADQAGCNPLVFFLGGMGDRKFQFKEVFENWKTENKDHMVYYRSWRDGKKIIRTVRGMKKCNDRKIVIIGYSYGGDTAYDVVTELSYLSPVLVTLDAVGSRAEFSIVIPLIIGLSIQNNELKNPSKKWINVHTSNSNYSTRSFFGPEGFDDFMERSGSFCDAVADLGGPYGEQKNAMVNLELKNITHCDLHDLLVCALEELALMNIFGEDWEPPKLRNNWNVPICSK